MKNSQVTISALGNILEWLDFGLFIFLAPVIAAQFFPSEQEIYSLISTLMVFAAGFICRPLGGILFGYFGDIYGRATPLRFSILLISATTLLVGLLPTYFTLGVIAPISFSILRLLQGVAIGGECSGIMIYLAESATTQKRGFITSFAATGANLGFLVASLIILILRNSLSSQQMLTWGWRVPFIIIGLLGSVIAYFRLQLLETPAYEHLKTVNKINNKPLSTALRTSSKQLAKIFGLNCMSATYFYVFFGCMPEYLQDYLNVSTNQSYLIESVALITMLVFVPISGILGDKYGRKKMLTIATSGMVLCAVPMFYLMQMQSLNIIILAIAIATVLCSIEQGSTLSTVVENCPLDVRYTGIAFVYNLGAAIFGGLSPLIVIWLTTNFSLVAPGYYVMLTSLVGLLTVFSLSNNFQKDILKTTSEK